MSPLESLENRVNVRPTLSFMPDNIKEMIAENTDIKTRYTLRKVSTHFRAAVDASKFDFLLVRIKRDHIDRKVRIVLDNNMKIDYCERGKNGCVVKRKSSWDGPSRTEKIIEGEDFIGKALNDLGIILKSPNVFCHRLILHEELMRDRVNIRFKFRLLEQLGCLRHKLSVGELNSDLFRDQEGVLSILRLLKPCTLKSLSFCHLRNMNKIIATEHWPFLEEVNTEDVKGVPISKFLHLRKFWIRETPLTKNDVKEIVQSILQRPNNFDSYTFLTRDPDMALMYREAMSDYWPNRKRIPIPGTDFHLEIVFDEQHPCRIRFDRRRNG